MSCALLPFKLLFLWIKTEWKRENRRIYLLINFSRTTKWMQRQNIQHIFCAKCLLQIQTNTLLVNKHLAEPSARQRSSSVHLTGIIVSHSSEWRIAWHNKRCHFIVRQLYSTASHSTKTTDRKTKEKNRVSVCVRECKCAGSIAPRMAVRKTESTTSHLISSLDSRLAMTTPHTSQTCVCEWTDWGRWESVWKRQTMTTNALLFAVKKREKFYIEHRKLVQQSRKSFWS